MPMIEHCLKELPECNLVGVIGYEMTSRKKEGANAEPIVIFRKRKSLNFKDISLEDKQMDLFT